MHQQTGLFAPAAIIFPAGWRARSLRGYKPVAMRVLNSVLGDASGGRWQVVCQYSRLLVDAGHHVAMLLDSRYCGDLSLIPAQVDLMLVRNRGHYDYPAAWRMRGRLRAFAPDLAIAHCSRSVALLRRALSGRAPLVAVSHSNKVRRLLAADAWIALSQHIATQISAARVAAVNSCYVIPNMIAVEPGRELPARTVNRIPRIGALGRFDRVKGLDVFVAALGELRAQHGEFKAVLAGAGPELPALKEQIQQLGLSAYIDLPGWVSDVEGLLAGLDVVCIPARSDAFGLTPLQAAVAGVPMVLSRVSGHREMFSENSEALFSEVGDSVSTALQLRRLMRQTELADTLRQAAYRRVLDHYSAEVVTEKILQTIDIIAEKRNNR
jgi:glycosyltransferase involved in cell wall biosynthesis